MEKINMLIDKIKQNIGDHQLIIDYDSIDNGPHIGNIHTKNGNGAAFMFLNNEFHLSSDLPEEEALFTHKYDEIYTNFELFILRLKQILENGQSTQHYG